MTNQLSDSKARKRLYQQKPVVIDVSDSQTEASTLAPVSQQIDTLKAIQGYNQKLRPARKAKDTLPEIPTTNVAKRDRWVKDYKKNKLNCERSYKQIGIVDGGEPGAFNRDKFSLSSCQTAIQRAQS